METVAFVVLRTGFSPRPETERKIVDEVRRRFGPIAELKRVDFVSNSRKPEPVS